MVFDNRECIGLAEIQASEMRSKRSKKEENNRASHASGNYWEGKAGEPIVDLDVFFDIDLNDIAKTKNSDWIILRD